MARESRRKREARRFGGCGGVADMMAAGATRVFPEVYQHDRAAASVAVLTRRSAKLAPAATIVDAQNVFDYCVGQYQGKDIDWAAVVPNNRPPFPLTMVTFERSGWRHAWLMWACDGEGLPPLPFEQPPNVLAPGRHCVAFAELHVAMPGADYSLGPVFTALLSLDELGRCMSPPAMNVPYGSLLSEDRFHAFMELGETYMFPAFMAVAFMHCKNVTVEPVEPDPAVNRERRKAGRKPFLRYHVLNIEPMKQVLRTEGQVESVGLKRALHIARGHFATYTPEKPLFGHFSGTVWKPAHVRGSARAGVVAKDYRVNPPQA